MDVVEFESLSFEGLLDRLVRSAHDAGQIDAGLLRAGPSEDEIRSAFAAEVAQFRVPFELELRPEVVAWFRHATWRSGVLLRNCYPSEQWAPLDTIAPLLVEAVDTMHQVRSPIEVAVPVTWWAAIDHDAPTAGRAVCWDPHRVGPWVPSFGHLIWWWITVLDARAGGGVGHPWDEAARQRWEDAIAAFPVPVGDIDAFPGNPEPRIGDSF